MEKFEVGPYKHDISGTYGTKAGAISLLSCSKLLGVRHMNCQTCLCCGRELEQGKFHSSGRNFS